MSDPLVSVIIPAYNCGGYLAQAIESVIVQQHPRLEIIVVDDGSDDQTAEVAQSFVPPVRYLYQPNTGPGAARNRGIVLATGSFLAFLDGDDLWVPDKLERQLVVFESEPELEAVFGQVCQFTEDTAPDRVKAYYNSAETGVSRELEPGYLAGTMLIRRESFARIGPFRTDLKLGEFIDWYLRATENDLRVRVIPELVLRRRIHTTNSGLRLRDHRKDYVRVLKEARDRRRLKDFPPR